MTIDPDIYVSALDGTDLPDDLKRQVIHYLFRIAQTHIDWGFGAQSPDPWDEPPVSDDSADRTISVNSSGNALTTELKTTSAAPMRQEATDHEGEN